MSNSENALAAGGPPFRIGTTLSRSLAIFQQTFWQVMIIVTLPFVVLAAMAAIVLFGGWIDQFDADKPSPALVIFSMLAALLLYFAASGAATYGIISQMRQHKFQFGAALGVCWRRTLPIIGVALVSTSMIFIGLMLLVVPGFILFCIFYVALPVCVVEGKGALDSLRRSRELTAGSRGQIFGLVFLVGVVGAIGSALIENIGGALLGELAGSLISIVWQMVLVGFGVALGATVYHDLRVAREGVDDPRILNVFE